MRKKLIVLSVIYAVFFIAGWMFNMQQGLYFHERFWRVHADGRYVSPGGDSIRFAPEQGFELLLGGKTLTAQLQTSEDGLSRIDFSDGFSMERTQDPIWGSFSVQVGNTVFMHGMTYIIHDLDALPLRFAAVDRIERYPFYNENNVPIGESVSYLTASGELIDFREILFHSPEHSTPEKQTVTLHDGVRLEEINESTTLYVNEAGEYLLNPEMLAMISLSDGIYSRGSLMGLLESIAQDKSVRRGHPLVLALYTFTYVMGALGFLFPEKMAFFGSRWKFRTEPELSDDGLMMAQIGNLFLMVLAVIILFLLAMH